MNQDTQSKFAAILAAQQAKVNGIVKPIEAKIQAVKPVVKELPKVEEVKPKNEPEAIKPELSNVTIDDLLNTPKQSNLTIVDYSDRSFAIVTKEKPSEDILNVLRLHGTFNQFLKCGKGWIFSKRHLNEIKAKLSL